jgi:hypothetical protein
MKWPSEYSLTGGGILVEIKIISTKKILQTDVSRYILIANLNYYK